MNQPKPGPDARRDLSLVSITPPIREVRATPPGCGADRSAADDGRSASTGVAESVRFTVRACSGGGRDEVMRHHADRAAARPYSATLVLVCHQLGFTPPIGDHGIACCRSSESNVREHSRHSKRHPHNIVHIVVGVVDREQRLPRLAASSAPRKGRDSVAQPVVADRESVAEVTSEL